VNKSETSNKTKKGLSLCLIRRRSEKRRRIWRCVWFDWELLIGNCDWTVVDGWELWFGI